MIKRLALLFLVCLVALSLISVWVYFKVENINTLILQNNEKVLFEIETGSNAYTVKQALTPYVDIDDLGFKFWIRLNPEASKIKAGMYEIEPHASFTQLMNKFTTGAVKQFSVTLLEGETLVQWMSRLSKQNYLINDLTDPIDLFKDFVSRDDFCNNDFHSLEGCLLPDTYFYTQYTKASDLLLRAYMAMSQTLNGAWANRFLDIPIHSPFELLILASIIEKETAIRDERGEIAGVFINRLNLNMRLQTDPTVIYGLGDAFDGNLTRLHLRTPTPYNTYIIKGLPITPISMPSLASIIAASRPDITDNLYFVANGSGGHTFSKSLDEHNKAVRLYLEFLRTKTNNKQNEQ